MVRENSVRTFQDLASAFERPEYSAVREMYELRVDQSAALIMDAEGREWARRAFARASLPDIENQHVIAIRDRYLLEEAILNPLRALRSPRSNGIDPQLIIDEEARNNGCKWCDLNGWHARRRGMFSDDFGEVHSDDERFCARANWARLAPISGLAFGDETTHNLLRLTKEDFLSLLEIAAAYTHKASRAIPGSQYFIYFLNGGIKSAGSVAHTHIQIAGRLDRHFGYAESVISKCPPDYWQRLADIHQKLGLAFERNGCVGWVNICPVRDRDITVISPSVAAGAEAVYDAIQVLKSHHTNSFSMAAILSPHLVAPSIADDRFIHWPHVVWRLGDRGDIRVPHSDIGTLELYGRSWVSSEDPWGVAAWLREFNTQKP